MVIYCLAYHDEKSQNKSLEDTTKIRKVVVKCVYVWSVVNNIFWEKKERTKHLCFDIIYPCFSSIITSVLQWTPTLTNPNWSFCVILKMKRATMTKWFEPIWVVISIINSQKVIVISIFWSWQLKLRMKLKRCFIWLLIFSFI